MLYSGLFVLLSAFSGLLRQIVGDRISPAIVLLIASTFTIIYFHIINLKSIKYLYFSCFAQKKRWLFLSFSVAIIWACSLYSPPLIGASLHTFIFFSIVGLVGISVIYIKEKEFFSLYLITLIGLIGLLIIGVSLTLNSKISSEVILGMLLSTIGGIFAFIYSIQSNEFNKLTGASASQILAIRFYLAIILSLLLLIGSESDIHINKLDLLSSILIAIFCFIAPLYYSQKGIESVGPEINAIICSCIPLVTAVFEKLCFNTVQNYLFGVYSFYAFFSILPYLTSSIRKKYFK